MTVSVSGSGNVAQYAIEKCMQIGAKVITASDSEGCIHDPAGFTPEKLALLMDIKNNRRARLSTYAREMNLTYEQGKRPWHIPAEVALPCATQNELDIDDARTLISNGVRCISEGANMPATIDAANRFIEAGVLYAPGKASNAGGVAVSGLEMSQNAARLSWTREDVDTKLHAIMRDIHQNCLRYGQREDKVNYVDGANIAGFVKVADAMLQQGVY
jgi:glutamate dehydrogenase (NADP+)